MGTTTIRQGVRYEVRRARRDYPCEAGGYCRAMIRRGRQYMHLTALPGHDVAGPWDVIRECIDCAINRAHPLSEHLTDYP